MVLASVLASRDLRHCPMHGPHALASTVDSILWRESIWPSRSMVARTCSDPGVTMKGTADFKPRAAACSATSAARLMSSYEELVHDPMSADDISSMNSFEESATSAANSEIGRARSGECGPTTCGSRVVRSILTT